MSSKLSLEEIQAAADRGKNWSEATLKQRTAIAEGAAAEDDRKAVQTALRFKEANGVYPWEATATPMQEEQLAWLKKSGIEPTNHAEVRLRMEALIRAHQEAEGKGK